MIGTQAAAGVANTVNANLLTLLRLTAVVSASSSAVGNITATIDPIEATVTRQSGGAYSFATHVSLPFDLPVDAGSALQPKVERDSESGGA